MGGQNHEFNSGDKAPNDGEYIEIGEKSTHNIHDPQRVTLKAGEPFPETSNQNRKWKRMRKPNH